LFESFLDEQGGYTYGFEPDLNAEPFQRESGSELPHRLIAQGSDQPSSVDTAAWT
jgi:hypothetical protein